MEKTCTFIVAKSLEVLIRDCLPSVDTKTDYALRRTLKSIAAETKTALESVTKGAEDALSNLTKYEAAITASGVVEARQAHPEGAKVHDDLIALDVAFSVYQLGSDVLDKPWPHDRRECGTAVDGRGATENKFREILAELEMVRENSNGR